jgi:hypothetical protein
MSHVEDMPEPGSDAHRAWYDSLTGDDLLIVHTPSGHQWNMIAASLGKRALQRKMDAGLRLRLLECLNGMVDLNFTADMLAIVEPMCDTAFQIWNEAKTLDRESDKACMASFRLLTSRRVFHHFITLNPSILAAIKFREAQLTAAAQHRTPYRGELASKQTAAPVIDGQPRYHIHNVPTQTDGPASIYPHTGRA